MKTKRTQRLPKKKAHKLGKTSAFLVFLMISPVIYGIHSLLLFLIDTYQGDGIMLHQYMYESRRQVALQLISGGYHILPLCYVVSALWFFLAIVLTRLLNWLGAVLTGVVGALTGLVLAELLIGKSIDAVIPFVLSGFLLAYVMGWLAYRMHRYKNG
ncbi:MAG: hypothetical protein ACYC9L_15385 [Sulfuricaulis sp.]